MGVAVFAKNCSFPASLQFSLSFFLVPFRSFPGDSLEFLMTQTHWAYASLFAIPYTIAKVDDHALKGTGEHIGLKKKKKRNNIVLYSDSSFKIRTVNHNTFDSVAHPKETDHESMLNGSY